MNINNVAFYVDSDVPLWHFNQLTNYSITDEQQFTSVDDYLNSNFEVKIAGFHVPFPDENSWLDRLNSLYDASDNIVVFCSELHERTVEQLLSLDKPKVNLFICGFINQTLNHANVIQWMDFFTITSYFYIHYKPDLLRQELVPNTSVKPKKFDVLLGCQRPHRDHVYQYITQNQLTNNVVMTYFKFLDHAIQEKDFIFETPGLEFIPDKKLQWTIDNVMYYGHEKCLSQIVPIQIYNDTYYSLVAETNFFNHFNFYTEKIVKPLLAGRLFVAICGQHFLSNLRSLGFKTFDGIIDESYDAEPDYNKRWNMAMEQVKYLCSADPIKIYEQAQPIVEHNRRLMTERDWYGEFLKNFSCSLTSIK